MAVAGSTDKINNRLIAEFDLRSKPNVRGFGDKLDGVLETQRSLLADIAKSGDLVEILAGERLILTFERQNYANSPSMVSSLDAALLDIKIAQDLVEVVKEPSAYDCVDKSYARPKNRIGGLPKDEARQFFRSQATRLLNSDKQRFSLVEKKIIAQRRTNLRIGEAIYTEFQSAALGVSPKGPTTGRSRS